MSDESLYKPRNQEKDPMYNREPGIAIIPGSNFAKEVTKYEQFDSKWTAGSRPGNPYTYRPFPKMLYRAQHWKGAALCMAAPPDPYEFAIPSEYERAAARAQKFTEECQRVVNSQEEMGKAWESGWRESPEEAVGYLRSRDERTSTETAHRNHDDRNMSEAAKREIKAAVADAGGEHLPEIQQKPRKRGRPRKIQPEPAA